MANPHFEKSSQYYRCRCLETQEEQVFSSVLEAKKWAQKVVFTFGEQKTFELTRVREAQTKFLLDMFERESFINRAQRG